MAFKKYSKVKIEKVFSDYKDFNRFVKTAGKSDKEYQKRVLNKIASIPAIQANPNNFTYLRNRSISGMESWGCNQNFDAFPSKELQTKHATFVNCPVDVDHINNGDDDVIGIVIDSIYVPKQIYRPRINQMLPFVESSIENGDQIIGDWVENLLAIDNKRAEKHSPGLVEAIKSGEVSSTSMGCQVKISECSVCGNKATNEHEFCFVPNTPITMFDGTLKDIKDIQAGDFVLDRNGEKTMVLATSVRNINEAILKIKSSFNNKEIGVTKNHPILSKSIEDSICYKKAIYGKKDIHCFNEQKSYYIGCRRTKNDIEDFVNAENLRVNDIVYQPIFNVESNVDFPYEIDEEFAWVLGLYVAEGCSSVRSIEFSLHSDETEYIDKLKLFFKNNFTKDLKVYSNTGNGVSCRIHSTELAKLFSDVCGRGAFNKIVPNVIMFNKDLNIIQSFLKGLWDGDGCYYERSERENIPTCLYSVSNNLINQVSLLLSKIGYVSGITSHVNGGGPSNREKTGISNNLRTEFASPKLNEEKFVTVRYDDTEKVMQTITDIKTENYEGEVYNFKTEDGTYIANGIIVHNCDHILYSKGKMVKNEKGIDKLCYEINHDIDFFEDSIILSEEFAKKSGKPAQAGGEGADVGAKILEIVASKEPSILDNIKKISMESNSNVGMSVIFKSGFGYWDLSKHPYGGDFKRFKGGESGVIVDGEVKNVDQIRVKLEDGRVVITDENAVERMFKQSFYAGMVDDAVIIGEEPVEIEQIEQENEDDLEEDLDDKRNMQIGNKVISKKRLLNILKKSKYDYVQFKDNVLAIAGDLSSVSTIKLKSFYNEFLKQSNKNDLLAIVNVFRKQKMGIDEIKAKLKRMNYSQDEINEAVAYEEIKNGYRFSNKKKKASENYDELQDDWKEGNEIKVLDKYEEFCNRHNKNPKDKDLFIDWWNLVYGHDTNDSIWNEFQKRFGKKKRSAVPTGMTQGDTANLVQRYNDSTNDDGEGIKCDTIGDNDGDNDLYGDVPMDKQHKKRNSFGFDSQPIKRIDLDTAVEQHMDNTDLSNNEINSQDEMVKTNGEPININRMNKKVQSLRRKLANDYHDKDRDTSKKYDDLSDDDKKYWSDNRYKGDPYNTGEKEYENEKMKRKLPKMSENNSRNVPLNKQDDTLANGTGLENYDSNYNDEEMDLSPNKVNLENYKDHKNQDKEFQNDEFGLIQKTLKLRKKIANTQISEIQNFIDVNTDLGCEVLDFNNGTLILTPIYYKELGNARKLLTKKFPFIQDIEWMEKEDYNKFGKRKISRVNEEANELLDEQLEAIDDFGFENADEILDDENIKGNVEDSRFLSTKVEKLKNKLSGDSNVYSKGIGMADTVYRKLVEKGRKQGLSENFGQAEIRKFKDMLESKFPDSQYYGVKSQIVDYLINKVDNIDMSTLSKLAGQFDAFDKQDMGWNEDTYEPEVEISDEENELLHSTEDTSFEPNFEAKSIRLRKKSNDDWKTKQPTFKDEKEFEQYLRNGGTTPDYINVAGTLFTMEGYDKSGREITYGDKEHKYTLYVNTSNRYSETKFSDANVELEEATSWRNDIHYAKRGSVVISNIIDIVKYNPNSKKIDAILLNHLIDKSAIKEDLQLYTYSDLNDLFHKLLEVDANLEKQAKGDDWKSGQPTFKDEKEFEQYLRSGGKITDYVNVGGILFTMDYYDNSGKEITYGDKEHKYILYVNTNNRYRTFSDAEVELVEDSGGWRTDINYAKKKKVNASKQFSEKDAGCWYDSARGWREIGKLVQETAKEYGWNGEVISWDDYDDGESNDNLDIEIQSAIDEAEKWMNQFAPNGYYFGSNDNSDWGLWKIDDEDSGEGYDSDDDWNHNNSDNWDTQSKKKKSGTTVPTQLQSGERVNVTDTDTNTAEDTGTVTDVSEQIDENGETQVDVMLDNGKSYATGDHNINKTSILSEIEKLSFVDDNIQGIEGLVLDSDEVEFEPSMLAKDEEVESLENSIDWNGLDNEEDDFEIYSNDNKATRQAKKQLNKFSGFKVGNPIVKTASKDEFSLDNMFDE